MAAGAARPDAFVPSGERRIEDLATGVELRYAVDGNIMGSILDNPDTCNFQIEVKTRYSHQNERVRCIQILRNAEGEDNVKVAAEKLFDGNKDKLTVPAGIKSAGCER